MLLAQETTSGTPLDELIATGTVGAVLVLMLTGWLWSKVSVDRMISAKDSELIALRADKERAEKQRDSLMETMQEKVLPALAQSSQVNEAMRPVLLDVVKALEEHRSVPLPRSPRG